VTNAAMHVGKKYVYNIDIKDFFPSISFFRIWAVLSKVSPFLLDNEVARVIANLCCEDKCLPQGAPTSPMLSNAVCIRLDRKLYFLSKKMSFTYSRYADDITISSNEDIFSPEFRKTIFEIIEEEGFEINLKKERLQRNNVYDGDKIVRERQEVTGIIVNRKTNVPRSYIKNLRAALHNWDNQGYEKAASRYEYYYKREKGFVRYKGEIPPFENYISGKLEYLGMVRGKDDPTYRLLKVQFDTLCMKSDMEANELLEILQVWDDKGLKKAMDKFYNKQNLLQENG
jgi:RNA-directed DNA polymerase